MKSNFSVRAVLLAGVLVGAGCVQKRIEPEYSPRVTTAQNSDGLVTLSWESKPGYEYTLYVRDPATRQWHPLKEAGLYRGTGEIITIQDARNPRKPLPWYSVRAVKL